MRKIDITNSLYHAIMSQELGGQDEDFRYEKLRSILEHGYILSVNNLRKQDIRFAVPRYRGINDDDYICLGCNPNSFLARNYSNISNSELNGYTMSQLSFGFALKPTLLDELECQAGAFNYEILVRDKISIRDYAIGLINAGGTIDRDVIIYDWYMQYISGEISVEEYQNRLFKYFNILVGPGEWYMNQLKDTDGKNFCQYMDSYMKKDVMELISRKDVYNKVKKILDSTGLDIPIVDRLGEEIPSLEHQKNKVLEFKKRFQ